MRTIVANYKMNGDKKFFRSISKLINKTNEKDTKVILCPPFVYMSFFKIKNKNVNLGSQDVSNAINTKSTGQISPIMLNEFGVKYSIVGHSERRANGEANDLISQKVENAIQNGIVPIVCVGEDKKSAKLDILEDQVSSAIGGLNTGKIIFAYEPVWAIGTGEQPTVKRINQAVRKIRLTAKTLGFDVEVLYGGSVNEKNYKELETAEIEGFLLGGVSLKVDKFLQIVKGE